MNKLALFIFRRDLRLHDNTALIHALKTSEKVIPCFIFTPQQIEKNPLKNEHCLAFMHQALNDLNEELKDIGAHLYFFHGDPHKIVETCIDTLGVDAVFANRDYTPFSKDRDEKIESVCKKHKITLTLEEDALLHDPLDTRKKNGEPYLVFTPFYENARTLAVRKPVSNRGKNYYTKPIPFAKKGEKTPSNPSWKKQLEAKLKHYPKTTTNLSPFLKFTVCSPRELYWQLFEKQGESSELIRQLFWRDFYTSIAFFFPHVFKEAFYPKFNKIKWSQDQEAFQKWCDGETGFPLIDAGMRELNATGNMPNRVRMAVASFLIKDLHIDWRWGEHYFAKKLIDYDPAVNNGNWQWVAGTGASAQPYFRIFNPWTQQKKFDPECDYIKEWVPELADLSPSIIHSWFKKTSQSQQKDYPPPMLDHDVEAKNALKKFP